MAYQHRVIKECYYGGVYRNPDSKHHSIVTTDEPFTAETLPSSFEPINYTIGENGAELIESPEPDQEEKPAPRKSSKKDSPSDAEVI